MNGSKVFTGAVLIACGVLTGWNANRLAAIDWSLVPDAEWSFWVAAVLTVAMLATGVAFVQRGLR